MRDCFEFFPYEPREGQEAMMRLIQSEVAKGKNVCIHATTGFGKTPAILAALLPFIEGGGSILWAVRTGNETDRPIEELRVTNDSNDAKFVGISYRGKRDMCPLARELGLDDYESVSFLCKEKVDGGECEYYMNFYSPSFVVKEFLKPMLYSDIIRACEQRDICPYLVQRELLPFAHVVAMSYNYIIDEEMAWAIRRMIPFNRSFLVLDEAHNMQQACTNLNSDRVTSGTFEGALREVGRLSGYKAGELKEFILEMKSGLDIFTKGLKGETQIDMKKFLNDFEKRGFNLQELFNSIGYHGNRVRRLQLRSGKRPHSSLHRLAEFWLAALRNLDAEGVVFIAAKEKEGLRIEMWDMRASTVLSKRWGEFRACVFCSGTLNPIKAFAEVVGLDHYEGKSYRSCYDFAKAKTLITKGISTEGEELPKEMARSYVEVVGDLIEAVNVNLAIFCSSYRVQADLIKAGLEGVAKNNGRTFFREVPGMKGDRVRKMLDDFKSRASSESKGVLCGSAGGRFAEGADFPGEELEAIFLVGVPFEHITTKTRLYLDYYENLYGKQKGRYYAYVVPALKRASQALGRALRSKRDRALLVCGDERYAGKRFYQLLPDYARESHEIIEKGEIVSKAKAWFNSTSHLVPK